MKSKQKRIRRQARLARNRVLDEHRDRMNALFAREDKGENIWKDCSLDKTDPESKGNCLVCVEDQRFEAEWRLVTRAVNWYW